MHCGMDWIESEAEGETVGVGLEAIIGMGQEQDAALGKEIDREPRRPDDERGRRLASSTCCSGPIGALALTEGSAAITHLFPVATSYPISPIAVYLGQSASLRRGIVSKSLVECPAAVTRGQPHNQHLARGEDFI